MTTTAESRDPINDEIARDRKRRREDVADLPTSPDIGLVTRTIVPSPQVNLIFHAQLRSHQYNDLVFIAEDRVSIYNIERDGGGSLKHVGTTEAFESRIWSAAICTPGGGQGEEDLLDVLEMNNEHVKSEDDISPQLLILCMQSGTIRFLTFDIEPGKSPHLTYYDASLPLPRFANGLECPGSQIAVDPLNRAVAVAAEYGNIMIYTLKSREEMQRAFDHDPESWSPVSADTTLSINACIVKIAFLHPEEKDKDQILLLVVTADLGRSGHPLKLNVYEWNHQDDLHTHQPVTWGYRLDAKYNRPQLIIPSPYRPTFIWVADQDIIDVEDILSRTPKFTPLKVSPEASVPLTRMWAQSDHFPLFTQWARAKRPYPMFRQAKREWIYLVREDGKFFIVFREHGAAGISIAGKLEGNASTAFTFFQTSDDPREQDLLISVSHGCPGEVISIHHSREELKNRQEAMMPIVEHRTLNWGPVLSASSGSTVSSAKVQKGKRDALSFTSNLQPFGALSELRKGYRADVTDFLDLRQMPLEASQLRAANGIWIVSDGNRGRIFFVSTPGETTVFGVTAAEQVRQFRTNSATQPIGGGRNMGYSIGLPKLDEETLLIAQCPEGRVIQVTKSAVIGLGKPSYNPMHADETGEDAELIGSFRPSFHFGKGMQEDNLCAAYHQKSGHLTIAFLTPGAGYVVRHYPLRGRAGPGLTAMPMPMSLSMSSSKVNPVGQLRIKAKPSCIALFDAEGQWFLAIAFESGVIDVFWRRDDNTVQVATFDEKRRVHIESMAVISRPSTFSQGPKYVLVCGLRQGSIETFEIGGLDQAVIKPETTTRSPPSSMAGSRKAVILPATLKRLSTCSMGIDPVRLLAQDFTHTSSHSYAVLIVGNDLVRLQYCSISALHLQIHNVYFWDDDRQSDEQPTLSSLQIQTLGSSAPAATSLFGLSDNAITMANLTNDVALLPRRRALENPLYGVSAGTPRIMIYSKKFNTHIIATNIWSHIAVPSPSNGQTSISTAAVASYKGRRATKAALVFVPAHSSDQDSEHDDDSFPVFDLAKNEKVMSMTLWSANNEDFLIVGLAVCRGENESATGRMMHIRLKQDKDGELEIKITRNERMSAPVRALGVLHDDTTTQPAKLVVGVGNDLSVYALVTERDNPARQRLSRLCSAQLSSAPIEFTCESPYIHVSTEKDSVQAWHFSRSTSSPNFEAQHFRYDLRRACSDNKAGRTSCHLQYPAVDLNRRRRDTNHDWPDHGQAACHVPVEVPLGLMFAAHYDGRLVGLGPQTRRTGAPEAGKTLFETRFLSPITQLIRGNFRPPWRATRHQGVLVDDIIACGLDGSFSSLLLVHGPTRTLLKFLENLVRWDKLKGRAPRNGLMGVDGNHRDEGIITIDPERDVARLDASEKTKRMHINGDILERFLVSSPDGKHPLLSMMERGWEEDNPDQSYRGNRRGTRTERFIELVRMVCLTSAAERNTPLGLEAAVDICIRWLFDVLNPVL